MTSTEVITSEKDNAILLYSEYEPYIEFVNCLGEALRPAVEVLLTPIEHFVIPRPSDHTRSCFVVCTNVDCTSVVVETLLASGNLVLNPGIAARARNRLTINTWLSARDACLVPEFWACANPVLLLGRIPHDAYPVILKPLDLPKQAHAIIENHEMLRHYISASHIRTPQSATVHFAQRYYDTSEYIKLYACASHLAAYRKFVPFRTPEPVRISPELLLIASSISEALDLDLFSADAINSATGILVVDVNTYPIFKYHPEAYNWEAQQVKQVLSGGSSNGLAAVPRLAR